MHLLRGSKGHGPSGQGVIDSVGYTLQWTGTYTVDPFDGLTPIQPTYSEELMKHPVLARTVIAGLAISMLGVTGCSRDEKADDTGGTTTTVAKEVEKSKNFKLDAPVKIVALISDPTNSADPNSVADFNDGAKMAIEEINEAGGLGGHPIEFKSFDTPPVGDQVVNSLNLALEEKPTILVGPVSSTATLAITSKVAEAKVPLIHNSTDPGLATDGKGGNEWVFASRPRNDEAAKIGARFLTEELGAKKVGILGVNAVRSASRELLQPKRFSVTRSVPNVPSSTTRPT